MQIRFWGVRGSFPVPGRTTNRVGGNTSCVEVCPDDGTVLVVDAGTGIRKLGQQLMTGPCGQGAGLVHLLISHTHWDHIQGIPFFAPLYQAGNQVKIYARQQDVQLETIFCSQTKDPYFPVRLSDVAASITFSALIEGESFTVGDGPAHGHGHGVRVRCARLNHPFISIGYRIDADGASLAYVSDTAPFDRILFGRQFIAGRPDLDAPPQEDAAKLQAMRQGVVELCRDCDLVVYDTMFRMHEYLARPHWGHSSPEHALELVHEAGARCLALFHHAPDRSDDEVEQDLQTARDRARCEVFAAEEGAVFDVGDGARRVD